VVFGVQFLDRMLLHSKYHGYRRFLWSAFICGAVVAPWRKAFNKHCSYTQAHGSKHFDPFAFRFRFSRLCGRRLCFVPLRFLIALSFNGLVFYSLVSLVVWVMVSCALPFRSQCLYGLVCLALSFLSVLMNPCDFACISLFLGDSSFLLCSVAPQVKTNLQSRFKRRFLPWSPQQLFNHLAVPLIHVLRFGSKSRLKNWNQWTGDYFKAVGQPIRRYNLVPRRC